MVQCYFMHSCYLSIHIKGNGAHTFPRATVWNQTFHLNNKGFKVSNNHQILSISNSIPTVQTAEFSLLFGQYCWMSSKWRDVLTLIKLTMNNLKTSQSLWTIHKCFNADGALIIRGLEILLLSPNY